MLYRARSDLPSAYDQVKSSKPKEAVARQLSLRQAWPQEMKGVAMAKRLAGRAELITGKATGIAATTAERIAAVASGRRG